MSNSARVIIAVIIIVAGAAIVFLGAGESGRSLTDGFLGQKAQPVWGFVGGEKIPLLEDPDIIQALESADTPIALDARKAGSHQMFQEALISQNPDLLWPASPVPYVKAKAAGLSETGNDPIFNSPLVFYSWERIADAFIQRGLAEKTSEGYYRLDLEKFLKLVENQESWADIGVPESFGTIMVQSTDPAYSNSGNQFMALVAKTYEKIHGDEAKAFASTKSMFEAMGLKERSSGDIFTNYLRSSYPAKPLIVGYENQIVSFAHGNPEIWETVLNGAAKPVVLYPEPTIEATHFAVALTENGRQALAALKNPDFLKLAWEKHGFRSGLLVGTSNPTFNLPPTVSQILRTPDPAYFQRLETAVTGR